VVTEDPSTTDPQTAVNGENKPVQKVEAKDNA
jgi:hypothetical protein